MSDTAPKFDSEHGPETCPDLYLCPPPGAEQLDLNLHPPEPAEEELDYNLKVPPWDDVELDMSEQNIFGSRTLPTNPKERVKAVIRAVREVEPTSLPEIDLPKLDEHLREQRKFLTGEVKIRGEKVARNVAVSQKRVFGEIWSELDALNHPLVQALDKVLDKNQERIAANELFPGEDKPPTLVPEQVEQFIGDLMLATQYEIIRERFNTEIAELKKPPLPDEELLK